MARKQGSRPRVITYRETFPADLLTPISAYLRLKSRGYPSFLLESVEGNEGWARYSLLGVRPRARLWIQKGDLFLTRMHKGKPSSSTQALPGNPWRVLEDFLSAYGTSTPEHFAVPFSGGLVGYLSYEAVSFLEKVPMPEQRVGPFEGHFMLFGELVVFDHLRHEVTFLSNVFLDEESRRAGERRVQREMAELKKALSRPSPREQPFLGNFSQNSRVWKGELGAERFAQAVRSIRKHIRKGDIYQAVLSELFRFELKARPFEVYRVLRSRCPSPYLFYMDFLEELLLGASPECLARVTEGVLETHPIAGTRPRGRTPQEDARFEKNLLDSVKERAEHLMLVDLGRNDVGRVARSGSVRVPEFMQVHRFSKVMHLVSRVEGDLPSKMSSWKALAACFPAGTLTGAPKIRAMEILAGLETHQRGPYGGAVVYADFSGRLDSCITIRSLYVRGREAFIRAGAGIVADSQAAREYAEVHHKTAALREAVAVAEAHVARVRS